MSFPQALEELQDLFNPESDYILSYGNYDMKQIFRDCQRHDIPYPFGDSSWEGARHINIKNALAKRLDIRERGMASLMKYLGLELYGTHHNGEDDCKNILRCIQEVFVYEDETSH